MRIVVVTMWIALITFVVLFIVDIHRVHQANDRFREHCLYQINGAQVIYGDKDLCLDKAGRIIDHEKHNASWFG